MTGSKFENDDTRLNHKDFADSVTSPKDCDSESLIPEDERKREENNMQKTERKAQEK